MQADLMKFHFHYLRHCLIFQTLRHSNDSLFIAEVFIIVQYEDPANMRV